MAIAANLTQTALTGSDAELRQALCETPISPPHGQASGLTVRKSVPGLAAGVAPPNAFGKAKVTDAVRRIAFIRFRPVTSNTDGQEGALTFDVKYADELRTQASRNGWIPCWFLPWKSGLLVKMSIEAGAGPIPSGDATIDDLPNPRLFFTAAINGCSVFAYGNVTGPTVVHAGFESNFADQGKVQRFLGGNSATMWRSLLQGVTASPDGLTLNVNPAAKPNLGEVNRYDYIRMRTADGSDPLGTPEATQLSQYLQTNRTSVLRLKEVNPWGSVFGLRTGTNWQMTLQRNVSIQYRTITQTGGFLGFGKKTVDVGPAVAKQSTKGLDSFNKKRIEKKYQDAVATSQFVSCVNLGHTDFFPGPQQVAQHAHNQIQFW